MQVVWDPEYDAFGKAISNGLAKVPTLHLVFHDSSGASLVVQWRDGKMEVLDNPLGVFANDPLLQDNYKVRWLHCQWTQVVLGFMHVSRQLFCQQADWKSQQ